MDCIAAVAEGISIETSPLPVASRAWCWQVWKPRRSVVMLRSVGNEVPEMADNANRTRVQIRADTLTLTPTLTLTRHPNPNPNPNANSNPNPTP